MISRFALTPPAASDGRSTFAHPVPHFRKLSLQRRQRLVLALRALDARVEGNSYRTIAEGLYGGKRIPERAWKTHDLRSRTIRLVQSGFALNARRLPRAVAPGAPQAIASTTRVVPKTYPLKIGIPLRRSAPPS